MSNIKKGARAYYADTDYKRDGMTEAYGKIDSLPAIPTPEESDAGKVMKVNDSGVYALSDDLHTPIVANPEGTPTADLNTITIGNTIYKVNDARVSKLLDLRVTIDSGGQYNANLPNLAFVDINNNAATLPNYTMTCDKPIQYGGLTVNGAPGVNTDKLPAAFTIAFASEFNIEDFPYIRLTKPGLFPSDVAKNIKIEYSLNGTDYVEIADLVSIDWTSDVHVYDMSNGEEVTTVPGIPTPTIADAGKVLTVDNNGEWELDKIPTNIIEELVLSDNDYHLTKYSTCSELYSAIGEYINKGIVPYIKVGNKIVPCALYQHVVGVIENSIFIGMCRGYQNDFLVDEFTIGNNSNTTVTITTYSVARTIYT